MGRISGITGADGTDKTVSGHFVKQNLHRSDGSDERRSDTVSLSVSDAGH